MVAIIITLAALLCAAIAIIRIESEKISRMEHLLERKDEAVKAQQKRVYELTGMLQRAQRIIDEEEAR